LYDQGIGRILGALEKNNAIENTVIIFISDNGGCAETAGTGNIDIIGTPQRTKVIAQPGRMQAIRRSGCINRMCMKGNFFTNDCSLA